MDPYLLTLAGTAGTSVVTLLVTDGWQQAKDGVVAFWRRFQPEAADDVERELEASRRTALDATENATTPATGRLEGHWCARAVTLLSEHPEAAPELEALIDRLARGADGQEVTGGIHMEAHAEGNGRVYQAGRDQHITEHAEHAERTGYIERAEHTER
ncbi:hypothetical protein ACH4D5_15675 [Streptomyces sp. NPDC018029]|uniref:hypothetical protein n=1 Tax=Streptomyces sp. NPDC018029 TaxID=3365032 RepID=UPI0037B3BE12